MRDNREKWAYSNKCNLLKSDNLAFIYWVKGVRFKRRNGAKKLGAGYYFESDRRLRAYERHRLTINEFYKMRTLQDIKDAKDAKRKKGRNAKAKNSKN